jgi:hypothetical protein
LVRVRVRHELGLAVVDQIGADDEVPRAGGRRRGAPGERLARDLVRVRVGVRVKVRVRVGVSDQGQG